MQCNWNRSASTGYTIMIIAIILGSIALMVTIYVIIFQKVRKVTRQLGSDDDRSRSAPYVSGSNQGPMATNMSGNQGGIATLAASMGDNQGSLATNKSDLGSSQDAAPQGRYSGMYNKGVTPIDNNKVNERSATQGQRLEDVQDADDHRLRLRHLLVAVLPCGSHRPHPRPAPQRAPVDHASGTCAFECKFRHLREHE